MNFLVLFVMIEYYAGLIVFDSILYMGIYLNEAYFINIKFITIYHYSS